MESNIKIQFSYNNKIIKKNLFSKQYPNTETKSSSLSENKQLENLPVPKKLSSSIYCRKIIKNDDKKSQNYNQKTKKIIIDSLSEIRLPPDFIDLSYDHRKAE